MAVAGLGVAIVPEMVLPNVVHKGLQILPLAEPKISRDIGIVSLRNRTLSPAAQQLVVMLKQRLGVVPGAAGVISSAP